MSQKTTDELQQNRELLRVEFKQLKDQMHLVGKALLMLSERDRNFMPSIAAEVVTPLYLFDATTGQWQSHDVNTNPQADDVPPRPHHRSAITRLPCQQLLGAK